GRAELNRSCNLCRTVHPDVARVPLVLDGLAGLRSLTSIDSVRLRVTHNVEADVGAITGHHIVSDELRVETNLVGWFHLVRIESLDDHRQRVPAGEIRHIVWKFIEQRHLNAVASVGS